MLSLYSYLYVTMIVIPLCYSFNDLGVNLHLLDEDPNEIFNKTLSSKSTSTVRNYGPPRTGPVPYTSQYVPPTPIPPGGRDAPSYLPSNRNSFTPPLPSQYLHPFADKATLRGSNSDVSSNNNRRPIPPPSINKVPFERIPIKSPDLMVPDTKKKSINTPSVQKLPESVLNYSEPSSSPTSTTHRINDTFDIVIPMVHNISSPSIHRILDNGKKQHDFLANNNPRLEQALKTKTFREDVLKSLNPVITTVKSTSVVPKHSEYDQQQQQQQQEDEDNAVVGSFAKNVVDAPASSSVNQDNTNRRINNVNANENNVNNIAEEYHPPVKSVQQSTELTTTVLDHPLEPRTRYILGIAWDIHVYLIAVLFSILICISAFSLCRIATLKWLLPCAYFFAVHTLLILIGVARSVYLFYDAYNIGKSFSEPVSRLLLNIVFPLLIAVFTVMFVFILRTVDMKVGYYYVRKTYLLIIFVLFYVLVSILNDLYAHLTPYFAILFLTGQCLFIALCVALSLTYIYLYKYISHASIRKPNAVYSVTFADPFRTSLAHALRVMLATSLLSLLMAAIQLIGMFSIYEPFAKDQPHPWLWWAFQLSVRVIEISICFLISWAAVQPSHQSDDEKEIHSHNSASGFALFSWAGTNTPRGSDNNDDIYPTICNTNQTMIHNYSLRTTGVGGTATKQVYEDIFPLNNLHHSSINSTAMHPPSHLLSHTTERRSVKKHPPDITEDGARSNNTLVSSAYMDHRRPNPSPSMLVDEKGIVRFRSFTDVEPTAEELFAHSHLVHSIEEYGTT